MIAVAATVLSRLRVNAHVFPKSLDIEVKAVGEFDAAGVDVIFVGVPVIQVYWFDAIHAESTITNSHDIFILYSELGLTYDLGVLVDDWEIHHTQIKVIAYAVEGQL